MVDLGCIKLPFEGPFNVGVAGIGIVWACIWCVVAFAIPDIGGPAMYASTSVGVKDNCKIPMIVTASWCMVYYNYVSAAVLCVFCINAFGLWTADDVTEKMSTIAGRWSGNMFEQAPVFLVSLWTYTMFCDYKTGGSLGILYIVTRLLYPFYYIAFRQFNMWFESCTQIGYGINGIFMLGVLVNGFGGDWARFAYDHSILAPIAGFFFGSFMLLPGFPFTPIYMFIHYKMDHKIKMAEVAQVARQPLEAIQNGDLTVPEESSS